MEGTLSHCDHPNCSKPLFWLFNKWHVFLCAKSKAYHNWHHHPHHKKVHIGVLALYTLIIFSILYSQIFPLGHASAQTYTKTWTSYNDFNNNTVTVNSATTKSLVTLNGSGSADDAAAGSVTLAPTTFSEPFSDTTYKDAGNTTANWDTATATVKDSWTWGAGDNDNHNLRAAWVLDSTTMLVGGSNSGTIEKSTDGGVTFTQKWSSGASFYIDSFDFISPTTGFAVGTNDTFLKTTDAGENWSTIQTGDGELFDIDFVDSNIGFAVGDSGSVYKTTNGGTSWTESVAISAAYSFFTVEAPTADVIYIAGGTSWSNGTGIVLKSLNGGTSWSEVYRATGAYSPIYAMEALSDQEVIIQHQMSSTPYFVKKTTDGGQNWATKLSGNYAQAEDSVSFGNSIYMAGQNCFYASYDRGENWTYTFNAGTIIRAYAIAISSDGMTLLTAGNSGNTQFTSYSEQNAFSTKVNASGTITQAKLSSAYTANGQSVTFYMSADGGSHWESATPDVIHTFTNTGTDLRWKVTLGTNGRTTAVIDSVSIDYGYVGTLSNLKLDAGGGAGWGTLSWSGTTPGNSTIKFNARAADSEAGLADATWGSDITTSGQNGNIAASGTTNLKQWLEFRAVLATDDTANLPVLNNFGLTYSINSAPSVTINSAAQGSDTNVTVSTDFSDSDNANATTRLGYYDGSTNLSGGITLNNPATTGVLTLNSVANLPASGTVIIDSEQISYAGKAGSTLTGITRGANSTTPAAHDNAANIYVVSANTLEGATNINSEGTYLDTGASASHTLVWQAKTDLPNIYTTGAKVKVFIDDREAAFHIATANSSAFTLDTTNPVAGATPITINAGASRTNNRNTTLTLDASDSSSLLVALSEDEDNLTDFVSYSTPKAFQLSAGDGTKTVYAKFKDSLGNILSTVYSDTIELDTYASSPAGFALSDISNPTGGVYQLVLGWTPVADNDFAQYLIERSTESDSTGFSELATFTNRAANAYIDRSLSNSVTYYYRIKSKDDLNNSSAFSTVIHAQPSGLDQVAPVVDGTPAVVPSDKSATITWTTNSENSDSFVEFGTTGAWGTTQGKVEQTESHSVTITGLIPETEYYFRVRSRDTAGNLGVGLGGQTFTTIEDQNDTSAPTLVGDPAADTDIFDAAISWETNEAADSFVEFGQTMSYGRTQGLFESETDHEITLSGLESATLYHYRIRSTDASGNQLVTGDYVFTTQIDPSDITPPAISGQNPSASVTDTTATVTWLTNEPADSFVEYGQSVDYGTITGTATGVTEHSVALNSLTPSTTYHFRVRSRDASGNLTVDSRDFTFTTAVNSVDLVPPTITSNQPTALALDTTATVSWNTDENADSFVEFGTTDQFGIVQGKVESARAHSVRLIGLSPETTYYFKVRSRDTANNLATSDTYTFTTLELIVADTPAPTISGATAQRPGADPEEVTVVWATDKPSTSQVFYGLSETSLTEETDLDPALNTTHFVIIKRLKPNTKYYYQVKSVDSNGKETVDEIKYFVTSLTGLSTPKISGVEATDITLNTAIISWETTVVTTSILDYGENIAYGSKIEDESTGSTTKHTIRMKDLKQGVKYHFRITGMGTSGDLVGSDDYVFSTLTMPTISNILVKEIASTKATVTWITNTEADSFIDFGIGSPDQSQGRSEEVKDHAVTLSGLSPATTYKIVVKSRDIYANQAVSDIQSFKTIVDTTPPVIKDLKSETSIITDSNGESKAQVIVSWSTDEPATSQVKYSLGVAMGDSYTYSTQEDANMTTSHIVIISNLQPSSTYHMMIVCKDASANIGVSDDYTVLTLNQDKSLLQYIVQILEQRFFWLKGLGLFQ